MRSYVDQKVAEAAPADREQVRKTAEATYRAENKIPRKLVWAPRVPTREELARAEARRLAINAAISKKGEDRMAFWDLVDARISKETTLDKSLQNQLRGEFMGRYDQGSHDFNAQKADFDRRIATVTATVARRPEWLKSMPVAKEGDAHGELIEEIMKLQTMAPVLRRNYEYSKNHPADTQYYAGDFSVKLEDRVKDLRRRPLEELRQMRSLLATGNSFAAERFWDNPEVEFALARSAPESWIESAEQRYAQMKSGDAPSEATVPQLAAPVTPPPPPSAPPPTSPKAVAPKPVAPKLVPAPPPAPLSPPVSLPVPPKQDESPALRKELQGILPKIHLTEKDFNHSNIHGAVDDLQKMSGEELEEQLKIIYMVYVERMIREKNTEGKKLVPLAEMAAMDLTKIREVVAEYEKLPPKPSAKSKATTTSRTPAKKK